MKKRRNLLKNVKENEYVIRDLNEENEIFYGEIIEYALKANTSIEDILKNITLLDLYHIYNN